MSKDIKVKRRPKPKVPNSNYVVVNKMVLIRTLESLVQSVHFASCDTTAGYLRNLILKLSEALEKEERREIVSAIKYELLGIDKKQEYLQFLRDTL
jgi:hypothetical protein